MLLLYYSHIDCAHTRWGFPKHSFPAEVYIYRDGTSGYAPQKRLQRKEEIRDSLQCVYRHINHPCIIHAPSNYANPNYFWGNYHSLSANSQNCLGFPTHYPLRLSPNIAIFHILIFSANDPILHRIQRNNNALSMNNESTASYTALQWCTGQTA